MNNNEIKDSVINLKEKVLFKKRKKEKFEAFKYLYNKVLKKYETALELYYYLDSEIEILNYLSQEDLDNITFILARCQIHKENDLYKSLSLDLPSYQLKEIERTLKVYHQFDPEIAKGRKEEWINKIENLKLLEEVYEKDLNNLEQAINELASHLALLERACELLFRVKFQIKEN